MSEIDISIRSFTSMAPDVKELRLLSAVTPSFLKVSRYYFRGKDTEALQARQKLRSTPFYAFLYQDFKKLYEVLAALSAQHTVSTASMRSVANLLDRLERNLSRSLSHNSRVCRLVFH